MIPEARKITAFTVTARGAVTVRALVVRWRRGIARTAVERAAPAKIGEGRSAGSSSSRVLSDARALVSSRARCATRRWAAASSGSYAGKATTRVSYSRQAAVTLPPTSRGPSAARIHAVPAVPKMYVTA